MELQASESFQHYFETTDSGESISLSRYLSTDELPQMSPLTDDAKKSIRDYYLKTGLYSFISTNATIDDIKQESLSYPMLFLFNDDEGSVINLEGKLAKLGLKTIVTRIGYTNFYYLPQGNERASSRCNQEDIDKIRYRIYCTKFNAMLLHSAKTVFSTIEERSTFLSEVLAQDIETIENLNISTTIVLKIFRSQYLKLRSQSYEQKIEAISHSLKRNNERTSESEFISDIYDWISPPLRSDRLLSCLQHNQDIDSEKAKEKIFRTFWEVIASFAHHGLANKTHTLVLFQDDSFDLGFQFTIAERFPLIPDLHRYFFLALRIDLQRYIKSKGNEAVWSWGKFSYESDTIKLLLNPDFVSSPFRESNILQFK
ncbi:MAG: hypothetical protein AB2809_21660 [Candidatus Thiodiazotropha sp.]